MSFAVRPPGNRIAAKAKIRAPRVAQRPPAAGWGELVDLHSGPDGGRLGARQGARFRLWRWRWLWLWRDAEGSGWRSFGAAVAVCPGGDKDGGPFDLVDRNGPRGQEAKHDADAAGDTSVATAPTPDVPHVDAEQLGGAELREVEHVERAREFGRGRGARASPPRQCFLPPRVEGCHRSALCDVERTEGCAEFGH